jgi:DNA-directed RNA polymerase subunit RPC12/RpoP
MRQIGGVGLILGISASLLGIFNAYPAWAFGVMSIPVAAIFTLAFQIDWKEKKMGLVCPKCGLRLAGAPPALKVLSTGNCPRCNFQIITYNK